MTMFARLPRDVEMELRALAVLTRAGNTVYRDVDCPVMRRIMVALAVRHFAEHVSADAPDATLTARRQFRVTAHGLAYVERVGGVR